MGYDLRYIFFTHKAVDGVPTPRKRLRIHGNRHRSRAQDPLDEEDVVACVCHVDGVVAPSTPSMACCSLDGGTHPDAVNAKAPRRRWQLTGIIGRVEAS